MTNKPQTFEQRVQAIQAKIRQPSDGTTFQPAIAPAGADDATREAYRRETDLRLRESVNRSRNAQTVAYDDAPESHRQMNSVLRGMVDSRRWTAEAPPYVPPAPEQRHVSHEDRNLTAYEAHLKEHKPAEYIRYQQEKAKIEQARRSGAGNYNSHISRDDAP